MNCEYCGQVIPSNSPLHWGLKIENVYGWDKWKTARNGHTINVLGVGAVTKIMHFVNEDERHFGGETEAKILFSVDGVLYMKIGTTDSYGETVWDKAFTPVVPKTEIRTEYRSADGR